MTLQIPRSLAGTDFEARVEAHRQAKLAHHQTIGVPAPAEHPLIEAAVRRVPRGAEPDDYAADFEIIEPTLDEQKQNLIADVGKQHDATLTRRMSPGKRRVLAFDVADVKKKIETEYGAAVKQAVDAKTEAPKLDEFLKTLPASDQAILATYDKLLAHHQQVRRHAAKLHAQIEDLTDETIAAWKPEQFPAG